MEFQLRPALEHEAKLLSDLAARSKAHWPHDPSYLTLARSFTHITSQEILQWPVTVGAKDTEICGFSAVATIGSANMLEHLWVEPKYIGKGLGRRLFHEAVKNAQSLGWKSFQIASDPNAEEFYLKMGATRVGQKESKIKPGLMLPLLEFDFVMSNLLSAKYLRDGL